MTILSNDEADSRDFVNSTDRDFASCVRSWMRFPPDPSVPRVAIWVSGLPEPLICNILEESHTGVGLVTNQVGSLRPCLEIVLSPVFDAGTGDRHRAMVQYLAPQPDGTWRVGCEWLD